jgi:predicted phosphodiesterase
VRVAREQMRIALISDPHGDLVALRAVISDIEKQIGLSEVLVGGDLAQGGPQPAEVVDEIRHRGWPCVRGNSDDFLVRIADGSLHSQGLSEALLANGTWSAGRLGSERVEYLRSMPMAIERDVDGLGRLVLVHATPWSNEEVVLPDAELEVVQRVVSEAGARVVTYGHIHTPYQRRVGESVLLSVGAIAGSNDADARPAYTIVDLGSAVTVEVRRVECPATSRLAAYERSGMSLSAQRRASLFKPGPFPVRSRPGIAVTMWP